MIDFKKLNQELLYNIEKTLLSWFPQGKISGGTFSVGDLDGSKGKSLCVNLKEGFWTDFATGDKGGDLISLYAKKNGLSQMGAYEALAPQKQGGFTAKEDKLIPPPKNEPYPNFQTKPSGLWTYVLDDGSIAFHVARLNKGFDNKYFIPYSYSSRDGWVKKAWVDKRPLYNLPKVLASNKIWLCEGEKAADACQKLLPKDEAATTWSGGANAWKKTDFYPLKNKEIILWPDNDEPGIKVMNTIAQKLVENNKVKIIDVSGFEYKDDAADFSGTLYQLKINPVKKTIELDFRDEKGRPSAEYDDFKEFFNLKFPNTKKDFLTNTVFNHADIDSHSGWEPINNFKSSIESFAHESGLSPTYAFRHLQRWTSELEPQMLIKPVKWDGRDHIKDALDRIEVSNIDHDLFVDLMKEWFGLIIKRAEDPKNQNRFVIFRGGQGIGKDFCIKAMLSGFNSYMNEIDFDLSKTELLRNIKGLLVGIIPEFDETNGSAISKIKSITTAESAQIRKLYQDQGSAQKIRCSFISASNFSYILRDYTGNRRFMIFDLKSIKHTFHEVNGAQILAQSIKLKEQGFRASKQSNLAMKKIIDAETPENPEDLMVEEIRNLIQSRQAIGDKWGNRIKIRWPEIAEEIGKISRRYMIGPKHTLSAMKKAGLTHRDGTSTYYATSEIKD